VDSPALTALSFYTSSKKWCFAGGGWITFQSASCTFSRTLVLNSTLYSGLSTIKKSAVSQWTLALSLKSVVNYLEMRFAEWTLRTPMSNKPVNFFFVNSLSSDPPSRWILTFSCSKPWRMCRDCSFDVATPSSPSVMFVRLIDFCYLAACFSRSWAWSLLTAPPSVLKVLLVSESVLVSILTSSSSSFCYSFFLFSASISSSVSSCTLGSSSFVSSSFLSSLLLWPYCSSICLILSNG